MKRIYRPIRILGLSLAPYHDWIDAERIIVNIHTLYKDFGAPRKANAPDYHALMARLRNANKQKYQ